MSTLNTLVNIIGILYGLLLISSVFVRNAIIESLRVDALFMQNASEATRPVNLVAGILFAGYGIYSLLGS